MNAKVVVTGIQQAMGIFNRISLNAPIAIGAALYTEGELTMTLAKSLTPVDTGRLRSSGRVGTPHFGGSRTMIELGFHTEYAVYVHENLSAHHKVGQAKFLETAVNQRRRVIEANLAAALARSIR